MLLSVHICQESIDGNAQLIYAQRDFNQPQLRLVLDLD